MIVSLTTAQFDQFLETDRVVVVVFSADWCQPCQGFKQVLRDVASQYPLLSFGLVDVDQEHELSSDFGIRSVPTLMIFREHVALCRESGVMTKQVLLDLIEQAQALNMEVVHQGIAQQLLKH